MKVIRNTTRAPMRVPLGGGRFLHLGPGQSGSVSDDAPGLPAIARKIEAGELELVGAEDGHVESGPSAGSPREFAHGHGHPTRIPPKGNRGG